MKSKTFLTLGLGLLAAAFFAGCATQKTRTGRNTNVLGGFVAVNTGSYQPPKATTIDIDGTKLFGKTNPSGTEVSALWGLITYTDY